MKASGRLRYVGITTSEGRRHAEVERIMRAQPLDFVQFTYNILERPDLKDKITVPDVLIQAHSASMGMIIYDGDQFPSEYIGDAFAAAQHGSWNRAKRTGYKVIRVRLKDGVPTGEYEDFMTGFAVSDSSVWSRPVGVAVARDGALLVSEDGNGTMWRVSYRGGP